MLSALVSRLSFRPARARRALATGALALLLGASAQAAPADLAALSLTTTKPLYEAGEDVLIVITGKPGDIPVLLGSFTPGPTVIPSIGVLDISFGPNTLILALPPFPASGSWTLNCPSSCDFALIGIPFFLQVVSIDPTSRKPTGLSNSALINLITGNCADCTREAVTDPAVNGAGHDHAVYLPGIGTDFVWVAGGQFTERDNGTARLLGAIERKGDPDQRFLLDVSFAGRVDPLDAGHPPAGSPKLELNGSAYAASGGPVHPETWHYYTATIGTLTGLRDFAGALLTVEGTGPAFQVGLGANGKNLHLGASGWQHVVTSKQPTDTSITLPGQLQGDINIDLGGDCDSCASKTIKHAVSLPGIGTKFVFDGDGAYTEFEAGHATLTGTLYASDAPSKRWALSVTFEDKVAPGDPDYPPQGSPKLELPDSTYAGNGGPVDTDAWHYYLSFEGTLVGLGDYAGAELHFTRLGAAFQVGLGASGKNTNYGASGWLAVVIVSQPTNGPTLKLEKHSDINIDLGECD